MLPVTMIKTLPGDGYLCASTPRIQSRWRALINLQSAYVSGADGVRRVYSIRLLKPDEMKRPLSATSPLSRGRSRSKMFLKA
jgi:hypothetical protein